jgi:predicted DNA-binding transcriptional regulator YafY
MFTAAEIEALVVGARMLKAWGGSELGSSAQSVLDKIHAVIPTELHRHLEESRLFAMRFGVREDLETTLDTCRHAIAQRRYLRLDYQRADHESSQRDVKPLGLFFWGNVWTLTAWCELRNDFRTFRLDRIRSLDTLERGFEELPGQTLGDFVRLMQQSECY